MKKVFFLTTYSLLLSVFCFAQVPEKINYQGVARNLTGNILPMQNIGLRFTIHSNTANGTAVYKETHSSVTNEFGLFNIEIGGGNVVSGNFSTIDWGNDLFFLQVEMDATGDTSYLDMGTSQLVSVPYALYAKNSASTNAINGTPGYIPVFNPDGSSIGDSHLMCNPIGSNNIGIGTTTPSPNAILDISSMSKGVLLPRLTTMQINAITVSPLADQGLLVYNIDTHSFWYYNGTSWVEM